MKLVILGILSIIFIISIKLKIDKTDVLKRRNKQFQSLFYRITRNKWNFLLNIGTTEYKLYIGCILVLIVTIKTCLLQPCGINIKFCVLMVFTPGKNVSPLLWDVSNIYLILKVVFTCMHSGIAWKYNSFVSQNHGA